jgi:biotin-(acetyl-CoA carboxylase) ligase
VTDAPGFPPLLSGLAAAPGEDPFASACAEAAKGCDAGLIVYALGPSALRAALVFAPEVPLTNAAVMLPLCAVGLQNALGALAPPEVGMHLDWNGGLRLNGATCGQMRAAASDATPDDIPDWLVVGFDLTILPESDTPGDTPDRTSLYGEGCADVDTVTLLEAWARHTLLGINRWSDDGPAALHREWSGLAWHTDKDLQHGDVTGRYLGIDENFGLLLKVGDAPHLFPLTDLLERTP